MLPRHDDFCGSSERARFSVSAAAAGRPSAVFLLLILLLMLSTRTILSDCPIGDGAAAAAVAQDCGNVQQQQNFEQQHRRLQQQREEDADAPAAATFLGHSVTYHPAPPPDSSSATAVASTVHCVGENYRPDAWMYRSCQFRNLCYDSTASEGEFLLFASAEEVAVLEQLQRLPHPEFVTISSISSGEKGLSLGSIHDPSAASSNNRSKWYPTVVTDPAQQKELLAQGYYQLPSDTVLFPMQPSTTAVQVWDDVFAIYTVLSGFAWEDKKLALLVSVNENSAGDAHDTSYWTQLGPALGISVSGDNNDGTTGSTLALQTVGAKKSSLVCAKYAAAGLGMIAATRLTAEDLSPREQVLTHAVGRGGVYLGFRAFLLNKMDAGVFNEPSLDTVGLAIGTDAVREQVVAAFQNLGEFRTQSLDPKTTDISQQAQFAATTKICIAEMADPSTVLIVATFLPPSSVFLVFETGQSDGVNERERRHVRDLLELMGHFRLYWLRSANDIAKIIKKESDALGLTLSS